MCFVGLLLAKLGRMLAGWVNINLTKNQQRGGQHLVIQYVAKLVQNENLTSPNWSAGSEVFEVFFFILYI